MSEDDELPVLPVFDHEEAAALADALEESAKHRQPIVVAIGQYDVTLSPGLMMFLAAQIDGVCRDREQEWDGDPRAV